MKDIEVGQIMRACCVGFDDVGIDVMEIVFSAILRKNCTPLIDEYLKIPRLEYKEFAAYRTLKHDIDHFIDTLLCAMTADEIEQIRLDIRDMFEHYEFKNDDHRERRMN
jgi:hypothetical protein